MIVWLSSGYELTSESREVLRADRKRRCVIIQNQGGGWVYVASGREPARIGYGLRLEPGQFLEFREKDGAAHALNAIAEYHSRIGLRWSEHTK